MDLTPAQATELFHLAFLEVLPSKLDRQRHVLKGGANLRYFFGSVRYSEDIDLDVIPPQPWNLADQVDAALSSRALQLTLRSSGVTVTEWSRHKQTDTTRRWKVAISPPGGAAAIATKIEFSDRDADQRRILEAVPRDVVKPYALRAPTVQHYELGAATEQKVYALAGRTLAQARDVFDLDLLLRTGPVARGSIDAEKLEQASERALELSFGDFQSQVLPFLDDEIAILYEGEESWVQMQTFVAESLEQAR